VLVLLFELPEVQAVQVQVVQVLQVQWGPALHVDPQILHTLALLFLASASLIDAANSIAAPHQTTQTMGLHGLSFELTQTSQLACLPALPSSLPRLHPQSLSRCQTMRVAEVLAGVVQEPKVEGEVRLPQDLSCQWKYQAAQAQQA
jgi:hypothetical protein